MDKKDAVISALKTVVDPHTGMNVYDMGLISDVEVSADSVTMTFMPTSPFCPVGVELAMSIREAALMVEGIKSCRVNVVGHVKADEINRAINA
ncbi:MAG: metal-sulfur cluster assembly factor [Thermoplasmata archaeon]|nr:metal-sulfur cluster assembly factor [Thermoplasmata archaeon]